MGRIRSLRRLARFVLLPACFVLAHGAAPRQPVGFDYTTTLSFPRGVTLLCTGDFDGDGSDDLAAYGGRRVFIAFQGNSSFDWTVRSFETKGEVLRGASGKLNGDRTDELALIIVGPGATSPSSPDSATSTVSPPSTTPPPPVPTTSVVIYSVRKQTSPPVLIETIPLEQEYQELLFSNLDGKGGTDLLLFGRKSLGLAVRSGNGKGGFGNEEMLFPELPVDRVIAADFDDDDRRDIMAFNWLSGEAHLYIGFGGLSFSNPGTLSFDDELTAIASGPVTPEAATGIVAAFSGGKLRHYQPDSSGEFRVVADLTLPGDATRLTLTDVDGDSRADLVAFMPGAGLIGVYRTDSAGVLGSPDLYSAGAEPGQMLMLRDHASKAPEAVVSELTASGEGSVRIFHNRSGSNPDPLHAEYAGGPFPGNFVVSDFNRDGMPDVVVGDDRYPILSVYYGARPGPLSGRTGVRIPYPGKALFSHKDGVLVWGRDDKGERLTLLERSNGSASQVATVQTAGAVPIAGDRSGGGSVLACRREGDQTVIVKFVPGAEIEIHAFDDPAGTILGTIMAGGSVACDVTGDGRDDVLVYAGPELIVMTAGAVDSLPYTVGKVPLPQGTTSGPGDQPASGTSGETALWADDLDGDNRPDLIVNHRRPLNEIEIRLADSTGGFSAPVTRIRDVRVPHGEGNLAVVDIDGKGVPDLVLVNERTRTVQLYRGKGRGTFQAPVNLSGTARLSAFTVSDLDGNGERELIQTFSGPGTLTVTRLGQSRPGTGR